MNSFRRKPEVDFPVIIAQWRNFEAWLAWVLERIQDHPTNHTDELLPLANQAMIEEGKAGCLVIALMLTIILVYGLQN